MAIVALGHEGLRTLRAWSHAEPTKTILIQAISKDIHLMEITRKANTYLLNQAERYNTFTIIREERTNLNGIQMQLSEIWNHCNEEISEVTIIPFGPKPIIAGIALWALNSLSDTECKICYSIPRSYDSFYSEGTTETYVVDIPIQGYL